MADIELLEKFKPQEISSVDPNIFGCLKLGKKHYDFRGMKKSKIENMRISVYGPKSEYPHFELYDKWRMFLIDMEKFFETGDSNEVIVVLHATRRRKG